MGKHAPTSVASFEQRAFEGLGNALKAMGYTGESLMKSFDMDGDSVLNYEEFKAGIAKTTGQNDPQIGERIPPIRPRLPLAWSW